MNVPAENDTDLLLNAYVDGELDAASALAFQRRIAAEPALAAAHDRLVALGTSLRVSLPRDGASPRLKATMARIGASEPKTANTVSIVSVRAARGLVREWRMVLAACLVGAVLGTGITMLAMTARPARSDVADVVSDHLRAVMAPQPFDVASSDQHTVKPWFTGRLSFAPQVFDLASAGFPLIGGRVDIVGDQPAAALAFRRGKHVISLISQPIGKDESSEARMIVRGFQVRVWTAGRMRYWAVSDVAPEELDALEAVVRARFAGGD